MIPASILAFSGASVSRSGHEPYRSWCQACVAGRGRADAHVERPVVEKGVPIIGATCGAEHQKRQMRQMESESRRQCFVEGAVWIGGSLVTFVRVVRSNGEPALLAHVRATRAMTMVSDVPLESVHEQVSKEQSPGNGLAEGAVIELKAKNRTLRHSTEMGLGRRIPETHDSLAWLETHAAVTNQLVSARAAREDAV